MDEELQKSEPKIADAEIVLIGVFFVVLDLIDIIPIAGDITSMIAAPLGFYYWSRGINGTTFIVSEILDLIPLVQAIPSRTIGWGMTVYIDRHPKLEAKLAPAIAIGNALEGNVENAGEATSSELGAVETARSEGSVVGAESAERTLDTTDGAGSVENENSRPSETKLGQGDEGGGERRESSEKREPREIQNEGEPRDNTIGGEELDEGGKETEEARYKRQSEQEYRQLTDPMEQVRRESFPREDKFEKRRAESEDGENDDQLPMAA